MWIMLIGKWDTAMSAINVLRHGSCAVPEWRWERNRCLNDNDVHCKEWTVVNTK